MQDSTRRMDDTLSEHLASYVDALASQPARHVGGEGNLEATRLAAETFRRFGWQVGTTRFDCVDWVQGDATLRVCHLDAPVLSGPFSLPCDATGPLAAASTIEELEAGEFQGSILLLHGDLVRGQMAPKNYPFWNPDEHQRVIRAIEASGAAAIVAATGHNPELAGAPYPFPFISDADFDVPNAYMKDIDGALALRHVGEPAHLRIESGRRAGVGYQVVARRGSEAALDTAAAASETSGGRRIAVYGHIDAAFNTPGALDNAGGASVLMGLAELLRDYDAPLTLELVPFNGEDNYAAPGEMVYLRQNEGRLGEIELGINIDGAGWIGHRAEISTYNLPPELEALVGEVLDRHPALGRGPEWVQSDHSILVMAGRPALAITTSDFGAACAEITHTPADVAAIVDPETLAAVTRFVADLVVSVAAPVPVS